MHCSGQRLTTVLTCTYSRTLSSCSSDWNSNGNRGTTRHLACCRHAATTRTNDASIWTPSSRDNPDKEPMTLVTNRHTLFWYPFKSRLHRLGWTIARTVQSICIVQSHLQIWQRDQALPLQELRRPKGYEWSRRRRVTYEGAFIHSLWAYLVLASKASTLSYL